jgi:ABC-type multidrug transport system ATPase subunit
MAQLNMIEAHGLTKAYGETQALAGVDFAVPAGSILGVLGPTEQGRRRPYAS